MGHAGGPVCQPGLCQAQLPQVLSPAVTPGPPTSEGLAPDLVTPPCPHGTRTGPMASLPGPLTNSSPGTPSVAPRALERLQGQEQQVVKHQT